jgi:hypothetical protein
VLALARAALGPLAARERDEVLAGTVRRFYGF